MSLMICSLLLQLKNGGPSTGRIRTGVIDDKTRVRMSKALQRTMEKQKGIGGNTSIRYDIICEEK